MKHIPAVRETIIQASEVKSLVWDGDDLIDWASGGIRFHSDGTSTERDMSFGNLFDAASSFGDYTVIYTRLGTKGLILYKGHVLREINRSYYLAEIYEYPVVLFQRNGRILLAHCPTNYSQLEIEDAATGERLTSAFGRNPDDFFHSRLSVSSDGRYLVSAGWVWHPVDEVRVFDIAEALENPDSLDGPGLISGLLAENSSTAFGQDGQLMVMLDGDINGNQDMSELRFYHPDLDEPARTVPLQGRLGMFMAVGPDHILGLYEFPHLVNVRTGQTVRSWPHIHSGLQQSAIIHHLPPLPATALDTNKMRCAIAQAQEVTIFEFALGQ